MAARRRSKKIAAAAAAALAAAAACAALLAWQPWAAAEQANQEQDASGQEGGSGSAPDGGSGQADDGSGASDGEEWPGQSLGYVGPNGEGAITGSDFASDEEFQEALGGLGGGWENRVETERAETPEGVGYAKGQLLISFYSTCSEYDAHAIVEGLGGVWMRDTYVYGDDLGWESVTAYFPACESYEQLVAVAEELSARPEVKEAGINHLYELDSVDEEEAQAASALSQSYLASSRFPSAWQVVKCDHAATVAVLDCGFDLDHPDLAGNVALAWDAGEGEPLSEDKADGIGHGTMVAGVASAVAGNSVGIDGASYNAWVVPIRICGDTGAIDDNYEGSAQRGRG